MFQHYLVLFQRILMSFHKPRAKIYISAPVRHYGLRCTEIITCCSGKDRAGLAGYCIGGGGDRYLGGRSTISLKLSVLIIISVSMSRSQCFRAKFHVHLKKNSVNPLNAELNPIRHLLALLGARHIVHVSRIRVKEGGQASLHYSSIFTKQINAKN